LKSKTLIFSFLAILAVVAATPLHAQLARNRVVGTCTTTLSVTARYTTISAAIAAAAANDVVYLCPGIYPEQLLITKRISLEGIPQPIAAGPPPAFSASTLQAVLTAPPGGIIKNAMSLSGQPIAAQIVVQNVAPPPQGSPLTISGFTVDGANNGITDCGLDLQGIYLQNSEAAVDQMVVRNEALGSSLSSCTSGEGIYAESAITRTVTISNNSVHDYQKNGITAFGAGNPNLGPGGTLLTAAITGNRVRGQGLTALIAQNGVQVSGNLGGSISSNLITDQVFAIQPNLATPPAAAGILIFGAPSISVTNNTIENSQFPIALISNKNAPAPSVNHPLAGTANATTVTGNSITNSPYGDGIDACSDTNTITGNTIVETLSSGIHLDLRCDRVMNRSPGDTVTGNTIVDSCTGILLGTTSSPLTTNTIHSNTGVNLESDTTAGDSCMPTVSNAVMASSPAVLTTNAFPVPR
jgi:hypothetical protein